eukprot:scaffold36663_cov13-Tisochrysis_lutea.AAC.1
MQAFCVLSGIDKPAANLCKIRLDAHRQQQLKQTAHEFATCYAKAIVEGSSAAPMFEEADPCIEVKDAHPLGATIYKGTDSVTMKLQQDHTTRYGLRTAEGKPSTQPQ